MKKIDANSLIDAVKIADKLICLIEEWAASGDNEQDRPSTEIMDEIVAVAQGEKLPSQVLKALGYKND